MHVSSCLNVLERMGTLVFYACVFMCMCVYAWVVGHSKFSFVVSDPYVFVL